ncbi:uncharacterized protein MELLADRAFT_104107 [Melampsora larici-populina 98AG31]|uniref:Tet-like 2OG-Fe(II) oxygenase domain-containing protein n=1 Tax=Melampsora larici-populina (strain 98AG31 / pathotype 3-4-7) TaxID=747676 RepID=F4RDL0_MELLP|nr:uncharacterized protein MELLADRAFT_104107 [Melampsora larici-populina 98AG31]EGG09420.1 hypothetical protein MELLADRAFT_104107 [Melampsora larici-populina 98AG31]
MSRAYVHAWERRLWTVASYTSRRSGPLDHILNGVIIFKLSSQPTRAETGGANSGIWTHFAPLRRSPEHPTGKPARSALWSAQAPFQTRPSPPVVLILERHIRRGSLQIIHSLPIGNTMTRKRDRKKGREGLIRDHPSETPSIKSRRNRYRHNRLVRHTNMVLNSPNLKKQYQDVIVEPKPDKEKYTNEPGPGQEPVILKDHKLWVLLEKRSRKVVALIRQTPFKSMTSKQRSELRFLANYLDEEREFSNPITRKGDMLGGDLGTVGFHKAFHPSKVTGLRPCKRVQGSRKLLTYWWRRCVLRRPKVQNIYTRHFKSLSKFLYKETCNQTNPHQKKDSLSWSLGIFLPYNNKTGKLAYKHQGFDVQGGGFWWPDLKCGVDFGSCDGMTEVLWRGNKELVCTRPSIEPSGNFTRVGTSFQVKTKYKNACGSITKRWNSYINPVLTISQIKQKNLKRIRYIGSPSFLYKMYLKRIEQQEKEALRKTGST